MKSILFGAILPLVTLISVSSVVAEVGVPREAQCLAIENGTTHIDGPCEFEPTDAYGSFKFKTYNGKYWGSFTTDGDTGEVYWNGEPYASHAHNIQRDLIRDEACWANDYASFCFW